MGLTIIPLDSINLDDYTFRPFGNAGETERWLRALLADGSGTVGIALRNVSMVAALKRAALKIDGVSFETPKYDVTKDDKGNVTKRTKTYSPPADKRMGAVFAANRDTLSFDLDLGDPKDGVAQNGREIVKVTVR